MEDRAVKGLVFDVQRFSIHDGPGIRTTVFLKGCPLSCWWCANPESLNPQPELGFFSVRCNKCKKCMEVCVPKSITLDAKGDLQIDRPLCTLCGKCVEVCSPRALTIFGRERRVEEILEIVRRDQRFYEESGGVTLSGGEPLMQARFAFALLEQCHEAGIDCCLETAGFAKKENLERLLTVADQVLFDIKIIDPELHKKYVGKDNKLILANAQLVASRKAEVIFRIPLIKGVSDSRENLVGIAEFLEKLGPDMNLEILPYHRMGVPKWGALGRQYKLHDIESLSRTDLEAVIKLFEAFPSIHVTIMQ